MTVVTAPVNNIYRRCLYDKHAACIPDKMHFMFRLQGLEFGGILHEWSLITESSVGLQAQFRTYSHDSPIMENIHRIRYSYNPLEEEIVQPRYTDVIQKHYSDQYIVTTDKHYVYLGNRRLCHNNFSIVRQPRTVSNYIDGTTTMALIDHGLHGDSHRIVGSAALSDAHFDLKDTNGYQNEIKSYMISEYKERLRLGR